MDSFLNNARTLGEHDSQGVFTISKERSAWKLGKYRLAYGGEYPIHLLASAVAGGATRFTIRSTDSHTHIGFTGRPFSAEELSVLDGSADLEQKDPRLAFLELAIVTAGRRAKVRFSSPAPGKRNELILAGGEVFHSAAESSPSNENTLIVEDCLSGHELKKFQRATRFAPLTIVMGHKPVPLVADELGLEQSTRSWLLSGEQKFFPARHCGKNTNQLNKGKSALPSSLLLNLSPNSGRGRDSHLLFYGVHLQSEDDLFDFSFLNGVVSANHLKTDLSGKAFLRNSEFEEFRSGLRDLAKRHLVEFCESLPWLELDYQCLLADELARLFPVEERPVAVELFLKSTKERRELADLKATKLKPELTQLASKAKELNYWTRFHDMEQKIESEVWKAWKDGSWSMARTWLEALHYLQTEAEREDFNVAARYAAACFLSQETGYKEWAQAALEDSSLNRDCRYRALLMLIPSMARQDILKSVSRLVTSPQWRAPFYFLGNVSQQDVYAVTPPVACFWEFARQLCFGRGKGLFRLLKQALKERESSIEQEVWYEVLHRTRRGSLSFREQVALRVVRARFALSSASSMSAAFEKFLEQGPSGTRSAIGVWFYEQPVYSQLRFPALVCQLFLISDVRYQTRARFLCRRLLLSTFDRPHDDWDFSSPLPEVWLGFKP